MRYVIVLLASLLIASTPVQAGDVPNDLTRQFCASLKVQAENVIRFKNLGLTQDDFLDMVDKQERKLVGTRNLEMVVRTHRAIIKGAWLTDDDAETYSEFVHQTCLAEIVLIP